MKMRAASLIGSPLAHLLAVCRAPNRVCCRLAVSSFAKDGAKDDDDDDDDEDEDERPE